jgi:dinuclear metal center YbgI/SA1388 family protein
MKIQEIVSFLESLAHPSLQEGYDNSGLLIGSPDWDCRGVLVSLDTNEEVVAEAVAKNCNLIVSHHPLIFRGLKKINGHTYTERTVIAAIKNDIAIYAIHTNLDNVIDGVNGQVARKLELQQCRVLDEKKQVFKKLYTFVPLAQVEAVRTALFETGAGHIGQYSECSFAAEGIGTFRAEEGTSPFVGKVGERHYEKEQKIEIIFPAYLEAKMIRSLIDAHPYEEVAYDIISLSNSSPRFGSGIVGTLPQPVDEQAFLQRLKDVFHTPVIRHTALQGKPVEKVAVCGGAGSFLISNALAAGAQVYITADMKYHEFFDAENQIIIADVGHFESEQFTIDLLRDILEQKFPTFAVLKTGLKTNPVHYF